ncbi:hypothetical protein ACLVWU_07770 [Bdellovibrio sp. HCB290]|uniref:spermine/spermidine synthase domain-containing protein n=1 Tax=Bdellovibrio sp. HCB290 TaxID=3394356 RepID=UPI0039B3EB44
MILLLVLFSGLLNLSAQVLYQKVVSVTLGDLYTTFIWVTLIFIAGAAVGNLFSSRLRKYLPLLEVLTGIYNLILLSTSPAPYVLIASLLLPAFCLGTQLPLYSYYLRQFRFRWIYALYHLGALLGLLGFEVYFTQGLSIHTALASLGLAQLALGLALFIISKSNHFHLQANPSFHWKGFFNKQFSFSILAVLAISTLSYFQVFWAVKTQTFLTEAFRLQATLITMAVFFWMSVAGATERRAKTIPRSLVFTFWAGTALLIQLLFASVPVFIRDAMTGTLTNYFALSFLLALFLTAPVYFSSLMFIRGAEEISAKLPIDEAASYLNIIASLGNIFGMGLAVAMASLLWFNIYFATAVVAAGAFALIFSLFEGRILKITPALGLLIMLAFFAFQNSQSSSLLINRVPAEIRNAATVGRTEVHSAAFSSIAIHYTQSRATIPEPVRMYYVDGHASHDLNLYTENLVGLLPAAYFTSTIPRSMVIGVGSGQTSWGVAAISQNTDLIEISPAVRDTLKLFDRENNHLSNRPNVQLYLEDGMNFLRKCKSGSYDLIVNTSTYPGNFNAGKLFTDEFMEMAKNCLNREGVYQTYFDVASVLNTEQRAEFLAPIHKHFKYVDIIAIPYPIVMAYNTPKDLRKIAIAEILQDEDRKFYTEVMTEKPVFKETCHKVYRNIPAAENQRLNTLDESILESNSIKNIVMAMEPQFLGDHIQDITADLKSSDCWQ